MSSRLFSTIWFVTLSMAISTKLFHQFLRHPVRTLRRYYSQRRYDYLSISGIPETLNVVVLYVPKRIGDGMAVFPVVRALQARGVSRIAIVASIYNEVVFRWLGDERVEVVTIDDGQDVKLTRLVALELKDRYGQVDLCVEGTMRDSAAARCFVGTLRARCNLQLGGSAMRCYALLDGAAQSLHDRNGARPHCWAELMREAGIAEVPGAYEFPIPDADEWRVRQNIEPLGRYVALNLDGSHPSRQLSLEQGKRLCELLWQRFGLPVVMVFGPDGESKARRLETDLSWVHCLPLDISLPHSVAIVKFATLVITPDTAVLHMASAWNRPTLGLYARPQHRWRPLADHSVMIETGGHLADLDMEEVSRALTSLPLGNDIAVECVG